MEQGRLVVPFAIEMYDSPQVMNDEGTENLFVLCLVNQGKSFCRLSDGQCQHAFFAIDAILFGCFPRCDTTVTTAEEEDGYSQQEVGKNKMSHVCSLLFFRTFMAKIRRLL